MTRKEGANILARFRHEYKHALISKQSANRHGNEKDENYFAGKAFAVAECYAIVFKCTIGKALDELSASVTPL